MKSLVLSALLVLASSVAQAGFIEVGASGNYKKVNLSDDVTDTAVALTGSMSYIFDAMSALELSYTSGQQKTVVQYPTLGTTDTTTIKYSMIGLDFILTLGAQDAILRPYVKAGVGYIINKSRSTVNSFNPSAASTDSEGSKSMVPSGGVGFRLKLSERLSLKAGIDAWSSKSVTKENVKVDFSSRVGLSWMF